MVGRIAACSTGVFRDTRRMHPLQESWDRTTAHLRAVRELLDLDEGTLGFVDEYLNHNELGLALDVLVDAGKKPEMQRRSPSGHAYGQQ